MNENEHQKRALAHAQLVNAANLAETTLTEIRQVIDYLEAVNRQAIDKALQESFDLAGPARENPTACLDHTPEWVAHLFEYLIERVPNLPRAQRITEPFSGWQVRIYASDIAGWQDFKSRNVDEIKNALRTYVHPRVQWCRPANVQLCRIKDAE